MSDLDRLIERRRKEREQRLNGLHLKLPIPGLGWDGTLVARYEVRDYGDGFSDPTDVMARLCTRLYLRDDKGSLVSILDDGRPVGFDGRFATLLGRGDLASARDVIRWVFVEGEPPVVNDVELDRHATQVFGWLQDTSRRVPGNVTSERADHEPPEAEEPDGEGGGRPTTAGSPASGTASPPAE